MPKINIKEIKEKRKKTIFVKMASRKFLNQIKYAGQNYEDREKL